jgi:hypothetical protein
MNGEEGGGGVVVAGQELEHLELAVALLQIGPAVLEIGIEGFVLLFYREAPDPGKLRVVGAQLGPRFVAPLQ